jgi:hypothetical protein
MQISSWEPIVWDGLRAMNTFPTLVDGLLVPGLPINVDSNIRFVSFLDSRLDGETVILLVRGIDGASILPAAFEILLVRWP